MPLRFPFLIVLPVGVGPEVRRLPVEGRNRTVVGWAGETAEKEATPAIVEFFKRHRLNEEPHDDD